MIPGEMRVRDTPLELNTSRDKRSLVVVNNGDRPIQVGSHLHLAHANSALHFDREAATGFRLDIPAGTAVRFEPGVSRTVGLVSLGGERYVAGLQIAREQPAAPELQPKSHVPFGTPGAERTPEARALTAPARLSGETASDEHDEQPQQVQQNNSEGSATEHDTRSEQGDR